MEAEGNYCSHTDWRDYIFSGAGFGISTAIASAAQLVGWAVGAGIGAIGGTVDAIIYSNDNQDYGQFLNRVKDGVVIGISAASLGMAIRAVINHKSQAESTNSPIEESANSPIDESTAEFLNSLDNDIQKFMYDERTNLKDLDAIIIKESKANEVVQVAKEVAEDVAKDSFRFSYELDK